MTNFSAHPPRPRSSHRSPKYPRCAGLGLAVALVACGAGSSNTRAEPSHGEPSHPQNAPSQVAAPAQPTASEELVMAVAPGPDAGVAPVMVTDPDVTDDPLPPPPIEPTHPDPDAYPAGGPRAPFDEQ